jgi:hypothetical protein
MRKFSPDSSPVSNASTRSSALIALLLAEADVKAEGKCLVAGVRPSVLAPLEWGRITLNKQQPLRLRRAWSGTDSGTARIRYGQRIARLTLVKHRHGLEQRAGGELENEGRLPEGDFFRNACRTYTAMQCLRRFVHHILPRGFVRIRQFGYLASTCRTARLALARHLLLTAIATLADVLNAAGLTLSALWSADGHRADPLGAPVGRRHTRLRHLMRPPTSAVRTMNAPSWRKSSNS